MLCYLSLWFAELFNSISWVNMSTIVSAIATFGLVCISWRQTKIQQTQTKIQQQAVKISLLEQRLACLACINATKAAFALVDSRVSFYNTAIGLQSGKETLLDQDKIFKAFSNAVLHSKYLFSISHYQQLDKMNKNIQRYDLLIKALNLEMQFSDIIKRETKDGTLENLGEKMMKLVNSGSYSEKKMAILLGISENSEYLILLASLQKDFADEVFFNSFDEYMDVTSIGK